MNWVRTGRICLPFSLSPADTWQGGEYKFGVKVDTRSFNDAPKEILTGVSQLTWAQAKAIQLLKGKLHDDNMNYSKESMSLKPETFNELLSLGYFEESRIKVSTWLSLTFCRKIKTKPEISSTMMEKKNLALQLHHFHSVRPPSWNSEQRPRIKLVPKETADMEISPL